MRSPAARKDFGGLGSLNEGSTSIRLLGRDASILRAPGALSIAARMGPRQIQVICSQNGSPVFRAPERPGRPMKGSFSPSRGRRQRALQELGPDRLRVEGERPSELRELIARNQRPSSRSGEQLEHRRVGERGERRIHRRKRLERGDLLRSDGALSLERVKLPREGQGADERDVERTRGLPCRAGSPGPWRSARAATACARSR